MARTKSPPKRKPSKSKSRAPALSAFEQQATYRQAAAFADMALCAPAHSLPAEFGFARDSCIELAAHFPNARVAYATATDSAGNTRSFEPAMITEQDAEKSIDYLRDSARRAAKARAEYGYLEAFSKVVKAKLMREHGGDASIGAQESIAYSHPNYQLHLDAVRIAQEAAEYERFMREAADAKFEGWRTQQANERAGRP